MIANMPVIDLTRLAFREHGDDGLWTEENAVIFSVAPENPSFDSWNDPRKERLVVDNFITVSRTQTHVLSADHR
jgi:hypothetical protein